jgi:hypothetical protein
MSVQNGAILKGATITPSGGTSVTYSADGQTVPNGVHLIDASTADYRVRPNVTLKCKLPSVDNMGVYSKDRKSCLLVIPKMLASGKVVFNLVRVEREIHPESTAAEALEFNTQAAQFLTDADYSSFWSAGSTI